MKKLIYRKSFLSMCAFITVCIFVFVYGFVCLAAEPISLVEVFDIPRDYISGMNNPCFIDTSNANLTGLYLDNYDRGFSSFDTWITFDSSSYVVYQYDPNNIIGITDLPDDSYFIKNDTQVALFVSSDLYDGSNFIVSLFNANGSYGSQYVRITTTQNVDNVSCYKWTFSSSEFLYQTNLPIYEVDVDNLNNYNSESQLGRQVNPSYDTNYASLEDNFSPTYMTIQCDSNFRGDGLITTIGTNTIQRQDILNGAYNVHWDYQLTVETSNSHPIIPNQVLTFNGQRDLNLSYFENNYNALSMIEVLSCMTSGSESAWQFMQTLDMTSVYKDTPTAEIGGGVDVGVANLEIGLSAPIGSPLKTKINKCLFSVRCTIQKANQALGNFDTSYDFLSGDYTNNTTFKSQDDVNRDIYDYNADNNLSYGDEGYKYPVDYSYSVPSTYFSPGSQGGVANTSGGSANSVGYGGNATVGNIVVNTGNDGKAVVDYTTGQLLPSGDANLGYVDDLEEVTESSKFVKLLSETFTFVPTTVWNDLGFFVKICLGILVSFFVLRLILDIL